MKGLELSKAYYLEYGEAMLKESFPHILSHLAIGLIGSGSECLGYDDEISRDHDFEPGFCIFLPDEETVDQKTAFLLERAYAHLPQEFMGVSRNRIRPVGGSRNGVIRRDAFYLSKCGNLQGN